MGDGGWGTALALLLNENNHKVTVWGPFPEYIETITRTHRNEQFLPGIELPSSINWSADPKLALKEADIVVLASPSKFFRSILESYGHLIPSRAHVVSVAKGFDPSTHKRMSVVAQEILHRPAVCALSGPSHAEEVARRIPTAVTIASSDQDALSCLQKTFSSKFFRVYTSTDITGIELGGALKNIIAIAVGVSDGIGFGDNTRAALITRGLAEITRLGCALGATPATFAGLSGMGDLIVTCTSRLSRNRAVGIEIGKGQSIEHIMAGTTKAVEGVWNCTIAKDLAAELNIDVPITEEVCAIIHQGKEPHEAVESLLARELKQEHGA